MLTIRAAKNPGYYEAAEFARDDYYTERGTVPGRWLGRSAKTLGLGGAPERGQLGTLLEGKSPRDGIPLPGGRGRKPSNAGFDLTFTAPKSVSVLLAVGDKRIREAILTAQDRATRAGLDYLERHECFARRGTDGVNVIPAEGFVGAAFVHEMSRAGDPHLHTHVVIANRVLAADGRWTAPDMRPVYSAAKTAGTIAEAVLRDELTRSLGVRWRDVVNGTAEIDGVPKDVLEHFSARHAEITEMAGVRGWTTERAIAEIQRETRDQKPILDREVAQHRWRARAAEHGLTQKDIGRLLERPTPARSRRFYEGFFERLAGPDGLTLQESTFNRRAVLRAIAEVHQEGLSAGHLNRRADQFLAGHAIPVSGRDGHLPPLYTTLDMLATEQNLIELASEKPLRSIAVARRVSERVIADHPELGADQADAVRYLTSGTARVRLMEARAGYGKTTALRAVREAYEAVGVRVIGASWQGVAAQELQQGAGIESTTVAALLYQMDHGRSPIPKGAVVILDEAGLMPTRPLKKLVSEVVRLEGRVIGAGDRDQLPSYDAGGAFAGLVDRLGVVQLAENRRQRTEMQRRVAALLAEGKADVAIALLEEHGRLSTYDDARWARASLVADWAETSIAEPHRAVIIAHDWRDTRELNKLARDVRDFEGYLGKSRIIAAGREWAAGDRLLCRRNDYREGLQVRNGTRATVTKVHRREGTLTIRTDGREIRLPRDYLEHIDYGYAQTGHSTQSATVDRTYVLATPDRGGKEWAYVAGSRHRFDLHLYVYHYDRSVAVDELQKTWLRSQAKSMALDRLSDDHREAALRRISRNRRSAQRPTPESKQDRIREKDRERDTNGVELKDEPEQVLDLDDDDDLSL